MKILMVGDVVGGIGRKAFRTHTPELRKSLGIDIVVVNGENCAGGKGFTKKALEELYQGGADIVTSGNHVWDKKDVVELLEQDPYLIRPANYPEGAPGKGACIYPFRAKNVGVMNLSGRAFMPPLDCPFQKAEEILMQLTRECDILLLDFHAETTSEKMAMGYFLDGSVQAVVGTHTHVQTADERILPQGTAYISDLGMVGPMESILGVEIEPVVQKFLTARPARFDVATGPCVYSAALLVIDDATNAVKKIERIQIREEA